MEEKDDGTKYVFYEQMDWTYERRLHIKKGTSTRLRLITRAWTMVFCRTRLRLKKSEYISSAIQQTPWT